MQTKESDFCYSQFREPHRDRTKEILKAHPEVRQYIGKNPYTIFFIAAIVAFQLGLTFWVKDRSWWVVLLVAYTFGAFAAHALFVMIHECAHNLLFKKRVFNTLAGIFANLPHVIPSSVSFQRYHLKHHSFQGVHELDADLPSHWEGKLFGNTFLGKALWLLCFAVWQITRSLRTKEIKPINRWIVINMLIAFSFDAAVYMFLGPKAFLYLLVSLIFAVGLHPLGARWIQEHYLVHPPQETYSYYGALNTIAFNVGYHNEHHDFPSVPWNKLPQVKQTAPKWYDTLVWHKSWTKLLFQFLFSKNLSPFSRMIRSNRGNVALDAEVKPDVDFIQESQSAKA
jgi:sphingolipid 4-desaturase/C4-monooxygenase